MKPYGADDVGVSRRQRQTGIPVRRAWIAVAVFCVASALLNGVALRESLSLKPYGRTRTIWLTAVEPVAAFSARTRMARIRGTLEQWFQP